MNKPQPSPPPALLTRGRCFIDRQNRQVLLHGINLVNKNKYEGYIGNEGPETFATFRQWGFNCLRLGVIWDGLEPQPGIFNEEYLDRIQTQLNWAQENDLYVFLDMHQDLYSVRYSDGAPEWATLTGGQPHVAYPGVWSDAYFTSPAIQTAWDHFWENSLAPDGVGLQDHYARAWQVLAKRFASQPNLIGYDLMNEPFLGTDAPEMLVILLQSGINLLSELGIPGLPASLEELLVRWSDPLERVALLSYFDNAQRYARLVDAIQAVNNTFEKERLMPMYRRVAQAIRQVDPHRILFLETSMGANTGVYSAIEPVVVDGDRDPQQAYSPHGYDLVVDTPHVANASAERVGVIFNRHAQTSQKWDLPMLVGEWGAYGSNPGTLPAARHVVGLFERWLCSETYWAYHQNLETFDCFRAIHRPYPERVAGRLVRYGYDPKRELFECIWQEDETQLAPSLVYLPDWMQAMPIRLDTLETGYQVYTDKTAQITETMPARHKTPGGIWLAIPPARKAIQRSLLVGSLVNPR